MSKKAPSKKKREIFPLDFITELFGLSPTEFLDELFDSANIVSTNVTDAIQEYLDTEYSKKYELQIKKNEEEKIRINKTILDKEEEIKEEEEKIIKDKRRIKELKKQFAELKKASEERIITLNEQNKIYEEKYKRNKVEIETGICKLDNLYQDAIDQSTDVLQLYFINNCLSIPNDISEIELHLPYEKDLDFNISDSDEMKIDNEIKEIKEMIIARKYVNTLARSTLEQEKDKVEKLKKIKHEIDKFRMTEQQSQVYPLHESLSFLVKNANELELLMERTKKEYKDVSFEEMYSEERKRTNFINNELTSQISFFNKGLHSSNSQHNSDNNNNNIASNSSSNNKNDDDYISADENKRYAEEYKILTSITTKENAQWVLDNLLNVSEIN